LRELGFRRGAHNLYVRRPEDTEWTLADKVDIGDNKCVWKVPSELVSATVVDEQTFAEMAGRIGATCESDENTVIVEVSPP
jgi:hypothetical protein